MERRVRPLLFLCALFFVAFFATIVLRIVIWLVALVIKSVF